MSALKRDPFVVRILVCAVVVAWLASIGADIVLPGYDPPGALNALFISLFGAILAIPRSSDERE